MDENIIDIPTWEVHSNKQKYIYICIYIRIYIYIYIVYGQKPCTVKVKSKEYVQRKKNKVCIKKKFPPCTDRSR